MTREYTAVFSLPDTEVRIPILREGKPVPASRIKVLGIYASGHTYDHMFNVRVSPTEPGTLIVKGVPGYLEVGTYDLVLNVAGERVEIPLSAPLDALPDQIENVAAQRGVSIQEVKMERGLVEYPGREKLEIQLAPEYRAGETLTLELDPDPNRVYTWRVNDRTIIEGPGKSALRYTFETPGEYTVSLIEREGSGIATHWSGHVTVVESALVQPVQTWKIRARHRILLMGPAGYETYEWRVDGLPVSTGKNLNYVFNKPGRYRIECLARLPMSGMGSETRRVAWDTVVQ
ncbi:MAG: hypothetical protein HY706_12060 [Candidatus Hydrogenedentes bacterium]|nr:hypothetical protein [Candidatus Hydrogenedentota bacterium]